MKKFKVLTLILSTTLLVFSCKDQLDVKNPNQPVSSAVTTENNITALGLGIYAAGFRGVKYGGFQGQFANDVLSYHEIMGDVIGVEAANVYINQLGMPDDVMLDDASRVLNPATPNTQVALLRVVNKNSYADQNPVYYEWAYMYALNNACNAILKNVEGITYTGNQDTKKNTLKAWAYWWKGYAYSRIGSIYYAGIITDGAYPDPVVSDYVSKDAMIVEANANLDRATAALNAIDPSSIADYNTMIGNLIPSIFKSGKGNAPTIAMWIRNINTMKARNLLVNKKRSTMTAADWATVLTLTSSGLTSTDNIFRALSNATSDFMSASGGTVALVAAADPSSATFKISERLIQDFKAGDKRLANNFSNSVTGGKWLGNSDRGNIFNTRWKLLNNATGIGPSGAGVVVLANRTAGSGEFFIGPTYEENELMKAEAKIFTGDLAGGLASVDAVRNYQGAGLSATAVVDLPTSLEELRKERRIGLAFRGLSFYDARRWGVIDPVSAGGGRTKAIVVDKTGKVNTSATINYNFLDYWDVPDNEIVYNPPSASGAPTSNPRVN
ncbi:MAG TPA: RagB/SusD family nutrient uptake outer membrane protein [Cyclobacteriaceae bacterium]|jgi:hypothetical protein|nr:RagB/SusD family nutrient uptake outer membrane protein [Cyclobacteriaceae bacterium]